MKKESTASSLNNTLEESLLISPRAENTQTIEGKSLLEDLLYCLGNKEMRSEFMKFLEGELSVENLAFYGACESLEQMELNGESEKLIVAKALIIRQTYIASNSINSVNLSGATRAETLRRLQEIESKAFAGQLGTNDKCSEVFIKAKKEVFRLMARDSFMRFKIQYKEVFLIRAMSSRSAGALSRRTSKENPLLLNEL
jgi:hypothetical protein